MTRHLRIHLSTTALLVAALATACGGDKAKKQTTTPSDSSGATAAKTPTTGTTATTPTGTAAQGPSLQDVIYFEFDRSELDADAKRKLEENASWLKENAVRTLTIEGHTDEVGTPEYNLGLGERRARASREYLVALGVDPARVSIITYGEERPAGGDDAQNRRSVFIATKKK
jgi:peptidoglycan-associated lipoprotein